MEAGGANGTGHFFAEADRTFRQLVVAYVRKSVRHQETTKEGAH
jgi:hypothetical protein